MRIEVYFQEKLLIAYDNIQKDHNKIPKTFEILTSMLGCPKCRDDTLVDTGGYTPCNDLFCSYYLCGHTIEVKSILAEGAHSEAFTNDRPFVVMVGSPQTYHNITKHNKTMLLYWYNIIKRTNDFVKIRIRNSIVFNMEGFVEGINCRKKIVLQRKKRVLKPRLKLVIFPKSCMYKSLIADDFKYKVSTGSKRQENAMLNKIIVNCMKIPRK